MSASTAEDRLLGNDAVRLLCCLFSREKYQFTDLWKRTKSEKGTLYFGIYSIYFETNSIYSEIPCMMNTSDVFMELQFIDLITCQTNNKWYIKQLSTGWNNQKSHRNLLKKEVWKCHDMWNKRKASVSTTWCLDVEKSRVSGNLVNSSLACFHTLVQERLLRLLPQKIPSGYIIHPLWHHGRFTAPEARSNIIHVQHEMELFWKSHTLSHSPVMFIQIGVFVLTLSPRARVKHSGCSTSLVIVHVAQWCFDEISMFIWNITRNNCQLIDVCLCLLGPYPCRQVSFP